MSPIEMTDSPRSAIAVPGMVPETGTSAGTRRSFLRGSAATAVLAAPAALMAPSRSEAAFPRRLTGLAATLVKEIRADEAQHVGILQKLLDDSGNPLPVKIRPWPLLNVGRLVQPNLEVFLHAAANFENTGSGFYGGALFSIQQTMEYFPIAVGLCTVEARHASWLNSELGLPLVPQNAPVEKPIDQATVLARVMPFVTNPVINFPSFPTDVVSDANNFAILDFLLFLEYIESAFYQLNVVHFT